jgi:hypothetical protein
MRAFAFLLVTSETLPCKSCALHMRQYMWEHGMRSPQSYNLTGRREFGAWVYRLHDAVNARLGKPAHTGDADEYLDKFPVVLGCGEERCDVSAHMQVPLPTVIVVNPSPSCYVPNQILIPTCLVLLLVVVAIWERSTPRPNRPGPSPHPWHGG